MHVAVVVLLAVGEEPHLLLLVSEQWEPCRELSSSPRPLEVPWWEHRASPRLQRHQLALLSELLCCSALRWALGPRRCQCTPPPLHLPPQPPPQRLLQQRFQPPPLWLWPLPSFRRHV